MKDVYYFRVTYRYKTFILNLQEKCTQFGGFPSLDYFPSLALHTHMAQ